MKTQNLLPTHRATRMQPIQTPSRVRWQAQATIEQKEILEELSKKMNVSQNKLLGAAIEYLAQIEEICGVWNSRGELHHLGRRRPK